MLRVGTYLRLANIPPSKYQISIITNHILTNRCLSVPAIAACSFAKTAGGKFFTSAISVFVTPSLCSLQLLKSVAL